MTYPLTKQGVFYTIQGEGILLGTPQIFVRLAGCNVNCSECDTDYSVHERASPQEITRRVINTACGSRWVWITGGEPTIHDLTALVTSLRDAGFFIALATAGVSQVHMGRSNTCNPGGFDFISVSPHRIDSTWIQRRGSQLNIVPGLNGLLLADLDGVDTSGFSYKYVTPCWYGPGDRMEKIRESVDWVQNHSDWRLGIQGHKFWGIA